MSGLRSWKCKHRTGEFIDPRDSAAQRSRRTEDTEPCWVKLDLDETTKEFQAEKIQESWGPV